MSAAPWIGLVAIATAVLVWAEARERSGVARPAKLAASAGFLALAWSQGAWTHPHGRLLLLSLGACAVGDACLLSRAPRWFLAGLTAFALGHVGYAVAFARAGASAVTIATGAAILAVPAVIVLRWLWPHVPAAMRGPVVGYVLAITVMVAAAWSCDAGVATGWIRLGASAFYLSDLSVARDVFVRRAWINRAWGLPTYYAAQVCLALAAAPR